MEKIPFKKPDVTAPRLRLLNFDVLKNKRLDNSTGKILDFYTRLKLVYPNVEKYTNKEIKKMINRCNKEVIRTQCLFTREGAELPANLGHIFMGTGPQIANPSVKTKDSIVNKKVSMTLEEVRIFANPHTEGNIARIYYTNYEAKFRFEGAGMWMFKPGQEMRSIACKAYTENWRMYFHVRKNNFISSFIRDTRAEWKKARPMYFGKD